MRVCASQKEKTSLGPVINSYRRSQHVKMARTPHLHRTGRRRRTFGTKPLKKLVMPSFFTMLPTILNPLSGFSKFRF